MNQQLQTILDFIQQNEKITAEEKEVLIKLNQATNGNKWIKKGNQWKKPIMHYNNHWTI